MLETVGGEGLLLTEGSKPLLRVRGRLTPLEAAEPLTGEEIEVIARTQIRDQYGDRLHHGREIDFNFTWRSVARIRASAFYQRNVCSLSLRWVPLEIPDSRRLGLPDALDDALRAKSGLILVAGSDPPAQCTTLASMVDRINRTRSCHIVTIEDPIEYVHANRMAVVSQREVGSDTDSFPTALRSVRREEADVVMIGELRDVECISAALSIAEAGRLVMTAVHTDDAPRAVERLIDGFPPDRRDQTRLQLASTLLAVLYQRLVPKVGGGTVAAYELLLGLPSVRACIREGRVSELRQVLSESGESGMQTLEESLSLLLHQGLIDRSTAAGAQLYPTEPPSARRVVAV